MADMRNPKNPPCPVLSVVFWVLSILDVLAGFAMALNVQDKTGRTWLALGWFCLGVISALISYGLAELIELMAQTAHYSRLHYELAAAKSLGDGAITPAEYEAKKKGLIDRL